MLSLGSRPRSSWAGHVTQPHLGPFGKGWGTGVVTSGQQVSARTGLAHRVGAPVGRAVSVCGHLTSQGQIHVSGEGPRFRVFPSKAASWCWHGDREDAGGEMAPDPSAGWGTAAERSGGRPRPLPGLSQEMGDVPQPRGGKTTTSRVTRGHFRSLSSKPASTSRGQNIKRHVLGHVTVAFGFCRLEGLLWPPWPRLGLDRGTTQVRPPEIAPPCRCLSPIGFVSLTRPTSTSPTQTHELPALPQARV